MGRSSNRKVWVISLTILTLLALFGFIRSPVFSLRQIQVVGNREVSTAEIVQLANVGIGTNIFQISLGTVRNSVALQPLLQSVAVSRKLPGTLLIKVAERQAVAMIPAKDGFVKVDAQGVFIKRDDVWPRQALPIISGIQIPAALNLGQVVNSPSLLQALQILHSLPSSLYPQVGEISAVDRDSVNMYTRDGLEIRLGEADQATEKFTILRQFLTDKNYKQYRMGYYVDLSTGQPVLGRR